MTTDRPADLVLRGGRIAVMDPARSWATALAVQDGRIVHDARGRDGVLETIAEYVRTHPDEAWVTGGGWYMADFPGGTPRREDLDRVVPDRPAFLRNRDGHGAWVNSKALELAGVTAATADPADGRIERDADGSPSGTLHEGARDLIEQFLPDDGSSARCGGNARAGESRSTSSSSGGDRRRSADIRRRASS